jgi:general secretion pathway protein H
MIRAGRTRRALSTRRGMTLIEIMIVMVLLGLILGAVVVGGGQVSSAKLKHTATSMTGMVRVAFTRATATSKGLRIVFDMDTQTIWMEEADAPVLVQSKDTTGTGGADPITAAEKAAVAEGESIIKGPKAPRPRFHAIEASGTQGTEGGKGPRKLDRGIKIREVQTAHDDAPRTTGRAYLYFWPGGLTERASIQVRIGDSVDDGQTLSLMVSPLTGKVTVKNGPIPLKRPLDDKEASEREDRGF